MVRRDVATSSADARLFAFDLTVEVTVRRHAQRPEVTEFTVDDMRGWNQRWQPLDFIDEQRIGPRIRPDRSLPGSSGSPLPRAPSAITPRTSRWTHRIAVVKCCHAFSAPASRSGIGGVSRSSPGSPYRDPHDHHHQRQYSKLVPG